jgi:signal transduction histidine kinase
VERDIRVSEAWAYGDGDKLKQVFWNIAQNAVRAMSAGGTLSVSLSEDGVGWRIGMTDNGVGMSQQRLEKIFEPFQSGFEGGSGLGLAIVYQILQAHDADIEVQSEPGVGTEVVLRFTRAEHAMLARTANAGTQSGTRQN